VGKTTLAKELAPLIDALLLSTDKIRKELIPEPKYTREEKELIYNVMLLVARYLHGSGVNCILDATFTKEKSRKEARARLGVPPNQIYLVECVCPEDVVISRLKTRRLDYSDADVAVYRNMKRVYEPVREGHIVVDTSRPPQLNAKEIWIRISKLNECRPT
jgi:predicted kinase